VTDERSPADSLGTGLAAQGDWLMLGSIANGEGRGAAYVFKRQGGEWVQHQKLQPQDLQGADRFGSKIVMSGDWALVSAPAKQDNAGAVYAFRYDAGAASARSWPSPTAAWGAT
jgi:hypothetical protein